MSETSNNKYTMKREVLPEIDGEAIEYVHRESGAKLLFLVNDDNNKAFAIGFRTPPNDDTGVFHILEHSVLCGSKRFPVKEPFVDLLKSSMQTFLNAMTFGDKTLYPVASTNEQDLYNLMDVYLDAVFHPNIYVKRQIFEQEGWHYELVDQGLEQVADDASQPGQSRQLTYNGVVFNEMKGALSDATAVLYDELQTGLFEKNCYAFESGGKPAAIPTLTYEDYLDEHARHYRTDNCHIIMYGNFDVDRALEYLDERYLSPVSAEQRERDAARKAAGLEPLVPRTIELHDRTCGQARIPMRTAPENACAGTGYVIGDSRDRIRVLATEILLDALLGSNEAPLKRRLLDKEIAHDIHAFVSDALLQPFAVIELQMPNGEFGHSHPAVIEHEMRELLAEGLDHGLVEAALSHEEFTMREHNFGVADGVVHAMNALAGWLYDDRDATLYLRYEDAFAELRRKLEEGYFEKLALELLCDNDHRFSAEIEPNPDAYDGGLADRLAEAQAALTPAEAERIDAEVEVLREQQEAPDAPEAIATLPRLTITDIDDAPAEPAYALDSTTPVACMRHEVATRGIAYAYRYFDLNGIAFDDLPYVSILTSVLGKLDTARHTAAELDTLTQGKLGNLTFFVDVFEHSDDIALVEPKFVVSASALSENVEWLATLPREIMLETDFASDASRVRIFDLLKQRKIGMERTFANSGHSCALARCKSYFSPAGVVREQIGNVGFYRFLCELIDQFDERAEALCTRLSAVAARVFCDNRCLMSFAGSPDDNNRFWQAQPSCGRTGGADQLLVVPDPVKRNEAFIVPSDVSYTALSWDRRLIDASTSFPGSWSVAARALSYDFLWNEVRVKGGAYGTGFQAMRSGGMRFYSYRDPHLDETLARFAQTSEWLGSFNPTHEGLEGFIVASVAKIDAPIKPRDLVRRQMSDHFTGQTPLERAQRRREVIDTTVADVRALSGILAEVISERAICSFGNREIIEGAKENLEVITLVG